jgi:hypothetical protein
MPKTLLACLLLLATCSGCASCQKALVYLFPSSSWEEEQEREEQKAMAQDYEEWRLDKESSALR